MPVTVAEYLGQRTDIEQPTIEPVLDKRTASCPFMNSNCYKITEGNKPVCSVRKTSGELWITCRHRLCSSKKSVPLSAHQVLILHEIANLIYKCETDPADILTKREEPMPVTRRSKYKADYVMIRKHDSDIDPTKVIIEMQGGGETSNTGKLSEHIEHWEGDPSHSNRMLETPVQTVGTLETNAWRRQQEQFIVKGNIVQQTGGKIAFCVGSPLYDYLCEKINKSTLHDLRNHNWTLALICICEDSTYSPRPGPIPLKINENKLLFTSYRTFVDNLTNQGNPAPSIFTGKFLTLSGKDEHIR